MKVIYYIQGLSLKRPLPPGFSENDIFQEAINRFFNPNNKWDDGRYPDITGVLCMIAKSLLSDRGIYNRSRDKIFDESSELVEEHPVHDSDPASTIQVKERWEELLSIIGSDENLRRLVTAYMEGYIDADDIAQHLNLNISEVYSLKRKLKDLVQKARNLPGE